MSDILPDLYVVEKIIDKRIRSGKVEYFVKWENYPETQNTWEPLVNLETVMFLVKEFEENRKKSGVTDGNTLCK